MQESKLSSVERTLSDYIAKIRAIEALWRPHHFPGGGGGILLPSPYDQFYLGITFRAGSRYEVPERAGISHLLEHMMFRGTKRHPEFIDLARRFEAFGGEWNAETGQESTTYWYFGTSLGADVILELFRDFLQHPALTGLERERSIVLREIDEEINEHGEFVDMDYHVSTVFWPGTSLALPITGYYDTVNTITQKHLQDFRKRHYRHDNAFITVAAPDGLFADNLPPSLLLAAVDAKTAAPTDRPAFKPAPAFKGPKLKIVENTDGQCTVQLAFLCPAEPSHIVSGRLELLSFILTYGFTSRLSYELREKEGLVYDVDTQIHDSLDYSYIAIEANVNFELLNRFFEVTFRILSELSGSGPTEAELTLARLKFVSGLMHAVHSPLRSVDLLYHLHGRDFPISSQVAGVAGLAEAVAATSGEEMRSLLASTLSFDRMAIVILGQAEKINVGHLQKLVPGLSVSYSISSTA